MQRPKVMGYSKPVNASTGQHTTKVFAKAGLTLKSSAVVRYQL